jgi:hypothetical protein
MVAAGSGEVVPEVGGSVEAAWVEEKKAEEEMVAATREEDS